MQIIKSKLIGFCNGVKHTVNETTNLLSESKSPIYCLGKIVHNEKVINKLESKGMITVDKIEEVPEHSTIIFRAHGEPISTYEKAEKKKLKIIDLTCGKVCLIHQKIKKNKDKYIIIVGKKDHPEVIAHKSYAPNNVIISSSNEINKINSLSQDQDIYVIAQTTFNEKEFLEIVESIKKEFPKNNIIIENTICHATHDRQQEIEELSRRVDKLIIIGSHTSSNTSELYKIAKNNCADTYFIEDKNELLNIPFNKDDSIGVTSGASTSDETIDEITEAIKQQLED